MKFASSWHRNYKGCYALGLNVMFLRDHYETSFLISGDLFFWVFYVKVYKTN